MKIVRNVLLGIICISLVVGGYYLFSSRQAKEDETDVSEVQKVILKNLEGDSYPATPREVVKFYNRILCCYYNETYTSEEFEKLTGQARLLMDEELADNNPAEQYRQQVETEVENYRNEKKTINNTAVCDSNDVKYATIGGQECAYIESSYFVRSGGGFTKSFQNYVLRKDEEGKWKILAFELKEGEQADE
jgi:hypothetical protein